MRSKTKTSLPLYPEFKKLITQAIKDYRIQYLKDNPLAADPSDRAVAGMIGLSPGALSSFLSGSKSPSVDSIKKLGNLYGDKDQRAKFEKDLTEHLRSQSPIASGGLLELLAAGGALAVSTLNYEPISGAKDRFFDYVFDRFWNLTGIKIDPKPRDAGNFQEISAISEPMVLLSYFSTLDRSLKMRFWPLPIRISLGAICPKESSSQANDIAKILSFPEKEKPGSPNIRLILLKGEVGEIHRRHLLKGKPAEFVKTLNPEEFVGELEKSKAGSLVPVILVDELTAIQCLGKLGEDGYPVLPLSGWYTNQTNRLRRELPQYFVSFACPRGQTELSTFLDDAWVQFLRTEVETTAQAYYKLYQALLKIVSGVAVYYVDDWKTKSAEDIEALKFQKARTWTLYTLQLDRASLAALPRGDPWRPILERARVLVQENLVKDVKQIDAQIKHALGDRNSREVKDRTLALLSETFDVDLVREVMRNIYGILTPDGLRHAIRRELLGKIEPVEIYLSYEDPATNPNAIRLVRPLLLKLSAMYSERGAQQAVEGITNMLGDLPAKFGGPHSGVLLAFLKIRDDSSTNGSSAAGEYMGALEPCIGCCCLRWISEGIFAEHWELRYLFVLPQWRGQQVAEQIVNNAKSKVEQWGGKGLVAFILPVVREGILFFLSQGFEFQPCPDTDSPEGRLVLRWLREETKPSSAS